MKTKLIFLKNFNFSILKKNDCVFTYVYTNTYFIIIKNGNSKIKKFCLNNATSLMLVIKNLYQNMNIKCLLRHFLIQFIKYKAYKIKFAGKGYKIKKPTKKSFFFLFNKSHLCIIWWKNIHYKKYKKYKTYIRSINPVKNLINNILNIRKIDIFTKKGLRLTRSTIFKKKGKK